MKAVMFIKNPKRGYEYLLYSNGQMDTKTEDGTWTSMQCEFFSPAEMADLCWIAKRFNDMGYETKRLEQ